MNADDLQKHNRATRRESCEDVLGCLGIGNAERLHHLDDDADFEAETAGLILESIRGGVFNVKTAPVAAECTHAADCPMDHCAAGPNIKCDHYKISLQETIKIAQVRAGESAVLANLERLGL